MWRQRHGLACPRLAFAHNRYSIGLLGDDATPTLNLSRHCLSVHGKVGDTCEHQLSDEAVRVLLVPQGLLASVGSCRGHPWRAVRSFVGHNETRIRGPAPAAPDLPGFP